MSWKITPKNILSALLLCKISYGFADNQININSQNSELKRRFQGIYGSELVADATFFTNEVIIINVDTGLLFNIGAGRFSPNGKKTSSYTLTQSGDRLAVPKHLRYLHFPENAEFVSLYKAPYFKEPPIVDITVPVAERIPLEILDIIRHNNGLLRIKFRLHPKTILIGWDVAKKQKSYSFNDKTIYTPSEYSHAGGDFQEAKIQNGKIIQKGWYIDPETRERVETDF